MSGKSPKPQSEACAEASGAAGSGPKQIDVVTLFPGLFEGFLDSGLLGRAQEEGLLEVTLVDLRRHGLGRHRTVDDEPYGGGAGMVLRPEPVFSAVRHRLETHQAAAAGGARPVRRVLLTPQGRPFDQAKAREFAAAEDEVLMLICGRYEGFDERIRQELADEEISLGDFITLGGDVAAMAVIEAVARLLPGVLGNPESREEESFTDGLLEYPQYTRPAEFEGLRVPEVLLSGDHARIAAWRHEQALRRTRERRPDLLPEEGSGRK